MIDARHAFDGGPNVALGRLELGAEQRDAARARGEPIRPRIFIALNAVKKIGCNLREVVVGKLVCEIGAKGVGIDVLRLRLRIEVDGDRTVRVLDGYDAIIVDIFWRLFRTVPIEDGIGAGWPLKVVFQNLALGTGHRPLHRI